MTLKQKVTKWKLEKQTMEEGNLKPNVETSEETGTLRGRNGEIMFYIFQALIHNLAYTFSDVMVCIK